MLWLARARVLRGARARGFGSLGRERDAGGTPAFRVAATNQDTKIRDEPAVNGAPARRSVRAACRFALCAVPLAGRPSARASRPPSQRPSTPASLSAPGRPQPPYNGPPARRPPRRCRWRAPSFGSVPPAPLRYPRCTQVPPGDGDTATRRLRHGPHPPTRNRHRHRQRQPAAY